jgi:hypothetical protein
MKIVRLTESDLHNMIMESVNSILTESPYRDTFGRMHHGGGRIPRDGMTGGEYYYDKFSTRYDLDVLEIVDMMDEELYTRQMHDTLDKLKEEKKLYFIVKGDIEKDETVGMMRPQHTNIKVDINPAYQAILSQEDTMISIEQKEKLEDILGDIANDIESGYKDFVK